MKDETIKKLKQELAEQEAKSILNKTLDGRIVKGGVGVGQGYGGTVKINK